MPYLSVIKRSGDPIRGVRSRPSEKIGGVIEEGRETTRDPYDPGRRATPSTSASRRRRIVGPIAQPVPGPGRRGSSG
jgi:hypothetical protein